MFDIAVMCSGNNLNETQKQAVLKGYFGDRWQSFQQPLNDWLWVYEYIALLWELAVQKEVEEVTVSQQKRLSALLSA